MLATELLPRLRDYMARPEALHALGLPRGTPFDLTFLAQGEYNINYLFAAGGQRHVVRVNVGTQIGKTGGEQIAYEAAALALLGPRGVAPRLRFVDATLSALPLGLLVMEFLPGGPLRYDDQRQVGAAARALARLHQAPLPGDAPFIRRRPLVDDLAEARGWLAPYLMCDRVAPGQRELFLRLLERAEVEAEAGADRFPAPAHLVHTDVQAHNFIATEIAEGAEKQEEISAVNSSCKLVDWERPLVDDPTYDLVHFLIPTTTQWKCGYTFSGDEQEYFLASYCAARPDLDGAELRARLALRRPFILLRAISWCAGAWVEYTGPGRAIDNRDTLERINAYLRPESLRDLFGTWLS